MKLARAPVANARPVFGNQFAITPVQTGNRPAWESPFATRETINIKNQPGAIAAVAKDHATATAGRPRGAPNRCPTHAPGLWNTAYEMKKALISQPDCSLLRPRSPRTVLSATPMALRLMYASAAGAQSHASTANRTRLGRGEDSFSVGCGSLISVPSLVASGCPTGWLRRFDHPVEQSIHLTPAFLIESEADRAADERVLENALTEQQVLLDGKKGIEAGLH